ncbi:MAG: hypothetical protein LBK41_05305 [Clostridiales bacterium]|nr:hypothetical protein [Clostridiales bacterium]
MGERAVKDLEIASRESGLEKLDALIAAYGGKAVTAAVFAVRSADDEDAALGEVTAIVKKGIRKTDVMCGLGGGEYLLIFPECPPPVVESIMGTVAKKAEVYGEANDIDISVVYVIAETGAFASAEEIVGALTKALKAKQ